MKFKNAKKRCNLYVKNFQPDTSEQDLRNLFGNFGEIESIKLFENAQNQKTHAFVCYKSPECAANAKQQLANQTFNGRNLYINNYEIKEYRKIQFENIQDKTDFQTYQKANNPSSQGSVELLQNPEIMNVLQQIM